MNKFFRLPLALATGMLVACGSDPGFNEETDFVNRDSRLQFVNMVTGSPELGILHGLNSTQVSFGTASDVANRAVDDYDWEIAYRRADFDEVTVAEGEDTDLLFDFRQTFLIMGTIDNVSVQIIDQVEPTPARIPAGSAEAWFAANTDSPAMMDVYITGTLVSLDDATPVLTLDAGSATDPVVINTLEDQRIRITRAASTDDVLFDSGTFNFPSQFRQMFAIVDNVGPDGDNFVDVVAASSLARNRLANEAQAPALRVANHTTNDSINVSIGTNQFNGIARETISNYQATVTGNQDVVVTDGEGNQIDVLVTAATTGVHNSLYLFDDTTDDGVLMAIRTDDENRSITERVNFQFVSGSPEVVDMYVLSDGEEVDEVNPNLNDLLMNTSGLVETIPGQVRFAVTNSDGSETLATLNATMTAGNAYTLVFDSEAALLLYTQ